MPYFAGLNSVDCKAIKKRTSQHQLEVRRIQSQNSQPHRANLHRLCPDQNFAFVVDVRPMAGVTGEEEKGQDEDGADQCQLASPAAGAADTCDCEQRDDDLIDAVVERPQELGPKKRFEAARAEKVAESSKGHGAGKYVASRKPNVLYQGRSECQSPEMPCQSPKRKCGVKSANRYGL